MRQTLGGFLVLALAAAGCRGKAPYEGKSVAQLEAMLRSTDPMAQAQGAFGLSRLGPEARAAVPALVEVLRSGEPLARQNAALALTHIGPDAHEAVPALTEALQDPDLEWLILDSTVVRAHPRAAGAPKKPMEPAVSPSKRWAAVVADSAQRFTWR